MRRLFPLAFALACAPADDGGDSLGSPETSGGATAPATTVPADGGGEDDTSSTAPASDDSSSDAGQDDDGENDVSSDEGVGVTSGDSTDATSDAGDDGASTECMELMTCCDQLGADIYTGCATVVDLDMPGLCSSTLDTYHADGYCTGDPYCDELADCCPELPPGEGWQDTCTYYADLGNQPQCAMLIGDYQMSGYCM